MSQSHPRLFEVERRPSRKDRLHAFMQKHSIQTHAISGPSDPECPKWIAVAMESAWNYSYGVKRGDPIPVVYSKVGRLLDESGCAQYGHTEEQAVKFLCDDYLKIPLTLD